MNLGTFMGILGLAILPTALMAGATFSGASEPAQASDENRVVCRRIEQTGSRMARQRVCKTAAQWRAIEREFTSGDVLLPDTQRNDNLLSRGQQLGPN